MADAQLTAIAVAVRDAIEGASFSRTFGPVREYFPDLRRENLATVAVIVMAKARRARMVARNARAMDYLIDVGIVQAIDPKDKVTVDQLMLLAEELDDFCATLALAGGSWVESETPVYDPQRLVAEHEFRTVVTATYRMARATQYPQP